MKEYCMLTDRPEHIGNKVEEYFMDKRYVKSMTAYTKADMVGLYVLGDENKEPEKIVTALLSGKPEDIGDITAKWFVDKGYKDYHVLANNGNWCTILAVGTVK